MTFAQRLAELLKNGNMTAYRLSKTLGVHQTTVKNWLDGNSKPRTEYMEKIAEHFGVSIDYLMGNSNDPHTNTIAKNDTSIVNGDMEGEGTPTRQIKQLNKLINHDPATTWKFLSILCRNERIEHDFTERYVSQSSNIPLREYLNFELDGEAIPSENVINILNVLNLSSSQVLNFLEGVIVITLKSDSDREKFLSDYETEHEKLLNQTILQILRLDPGELVKLLDNFQANFPKSKDQDLKKLEKVMKEVHSNKIRPQNEPGADG